MKKEFAQISTVIILLGAINLACAQPLASFGPPTPTATPTKTPTALATETPQPVALVATILPTPTDVPPTPTPLPTEIPTEAATPTEEPTLEPTATETPTPAPPTATFTPAPPTATFTPVPPTATPEPEFAYQIVHYKVLGEGENNGGIFNKGGMHMIFVTVIDENGNGIDGAVLKDANGSGNEWVTGNKGPGKTEITMDWDPYKWYVAADPNGPPTSQTSNQMNNPFPHIPDVVGKLGSIDNEYSVCPTIDIRCTPPFYNVHFSYEITFQRMP